MNLVWQGPKLKYHELNRALGTGGNFCKRLWKVLLPFQKQPCIDTQMGKSNPCMLYFRVICYFIAYIKPAIYQAQNIKTLMMETWEQEHTLFQSITCACLVFKTTRRIPRFLLCDKMYSYVTVWEWICIYGTSKLLMQNDR